MKRMSMRRSWALSVVSVVSLTVGVVAGTPGAALAAIPPAPTVPAPIFGDPVPGSSLGELADLGGGDASQSVSVPFPADIPDTPAASIDTPATDVQGVTTTGEAESTPATVVGDWKDVGNSRIKVAAASNGNHPAKASSKPQTGSKPPKTPQPKGSEPATPTPTPTPSPSPRLTPGTSPTE
ncbi:hypothetical protein [Microbacterium sp. 2MCAF23]|uniref:hypothetical protein n=1 Tax=Microbacterium sp. 2MCAF23 TaxID=3232985 RepID=UPI003F9A0AE9